MSKKALFLLGVFLAPYMGKLFVLIDFKLNQEYIAKFLCIQKDEENNCCAGKCQLTKRLNEVDENVPRPVQFPQNQKAKEKIENLLFLDSGSSCCVPIHANGLKSLIIHSTIFHSQNFISKIFQPPENSKG